MDPSSDPSPDPSSDPGSDPGFILSLSQATYVHNIEIWLVLNLEGLNITEIS